MFLWFGFVQGECRGRHTFWAHRGGGLRIPEPGRHTIEPFRGKFTKKFSIVMYKYQQICTKSIIFTPTEYKTTDSGGHGTYFREGNFPPKPPYTARNFRQDTGRARETRGHPWRAQGRTAGETGKSAAEKQKSATKNRKSAAEFIFSAALFRAIPGKVQIKAGHARQVP